MGVSKAAETPSGNKRRLRAAQRLYRTWNGLDGGGGGGGDVDRGDDDTSVADDEELESFEYCFI